MGRLPKEISRKRAADAYDLRLKGKTYTEIGQTLGISRCGATRACRRAEDASSALKSNDNALLRQKHARILTRIASVHLLEWSRSPTPDRARTVIECLRDIRAMAGANLDKTYQRPTRLGKRRAELQAMRTAIDREAGGEDVLKTLQAIEIEVFGIRPHPAGALGPLEAYMHVPRAD